MTGTAARWSTTTITFYGNTAWHGGYYNGGYHNGYGYHNDYNRTAVNNFNGSASRVNNLNREEDRTECRSRRLLELTTKAHSEDRMPSAAWAIASADSAVGLRAPTASAAGEACAPAVSAAAGSAAALRRLWRRRLPRRRVPALDCHTERILCRTYFELQASNIPAVDRAGLLYCGGQALGGKGCAIGGKDGSQDVRVPVRSGRGVAGRGSVR